MIRKVFLLAFISIIQLQVYGKKPVHISINKNLLQFNGAENCSRAVVEIYTLSGKRAFSTVLSPNQGLAPSIDISRIMTERGNSPLILRYTIDNQRSASLITAMDGRISVISLKERPAAGKKSYESRIELAGPLADGNLREGLLDGQKITFEETDGEWIFEGDIMLKPEEALGKAQGTGRSLSGAKWPDRRVPFLIESNVPDPSRITEAVSVYDHLGFHFVPYNGEINHVVFTRGDGSSSYVGMMGGRQEIRINDNASAGAVMHEMGHTLGLFHEQSRTDRASWIRLDTTNVAPENRHIFRTFSQLGYDGFNHLGFDFLSLMTYDSWALAVDQSKPVMTKLDGSTWSLQRTGPSAGDIATLKKMYPQNHTASTSSASINEVFRVDGTGNVQASSRKIWLGVENWSRWSTILNGKTIPGGSVNVVNRHWNTDIFFISKDGSVLTANRDTTPEWQGWRLISGITLKAVPPLTAVSRNDNRMDLFAVQSDGYAYNASWNQYAGVKYVEDGIWGKWSKIGNTRFAGGAQIEAVCRDTGRIELFAIGENGNLYSANWNQSIAKWSEWSDIGNPGQKLVNVTAVKSSFSVIHVTAVTLDGRVFSCEKRIDGYKMFWTRWKQVAGGVAAHGCKVSAVSREDGKVDLFMYSPDYHLYTAAWDAAIDAQNTYRGWWKIGSAEYTKGTQLSCSGKQGLLQVMTISDNGVVSVNKWTSTGGWGTVLRISE